jgi:hypothetical protein
MNVFHITELNVKTMQFLKQIIMVAKQLLGKTIIVRFMFRPIWIGHVILGLTFLGEPKGIQRCLRYSSETPIYVVNIRNIYHNTI